MLKTYKGGKGSSGTYQTIINYIPPCNLIVSPFFGNGYVERTIKCPENGIVGCELNDQMQIHFEEFKSTGQDSINIEAGCGIKLLEEIRECYKETDFIECYVRFGNILKRFGKRSMDRFTTTVNMKKLYIY
ncbi:MAG: hypothetical protein KJ607_12670, partial [Bacteroidetes bacterium]|nr:hypothetical protein [Bacteroidota bacterium]